MREHRLSQNRGLRACAYLVLGALWLLHFDFWNWESVHPIYLGVFPVGLFYHVLYTTFGLLFMPLFYHLVWPSDPPDIDRR